MRQCGFVLRDGQSMVTWPEYKYSIIYAGFVPSSLFLALNFTALYANPEKFSHVQNPIMNTTNESLQPSTAHRRTNGLFMALKKIAAVTIALMGIGLILWLDSWYMNHSDMPTVSRDMSYGLLTLILVIWALRPNIKRLIQGTERRVGIFARKSTPN